MLHIGYYRKYTTTESSILSLDLSSKTLLDDIVLPDYFVHDEKVHEIYGLYFDIYSGREGIKIRATYNRFVENPWHIAIVSFFRNRPIPDWLLEEPVGDSNILKIKVPAYTTVAYGDFSSYYDPDDPPKPKYAKIENNEEIIQFHAETEKGRKAEEKLKKLNNKFKYPIEYINMAFDGEVLHPFCFYCKLAGGPLNLRTDDGAVNTILRDDYNAIEEIFNPCWGEKVDYAEVNAEEKLKEYLIKVSEYGYFFLPIRYKKLNDKNYAPWLFDIIDDKSVYSNIENTAKFLTEYAANTPEGRQAFSEKYGNRIYQIIVSLKDYKNVPPEDYHIIAKELSKMFKMYNDFVTKEYNERKDDAKYQQRHEYDIL